MKVISMALCLVMTVIILTSCKKDNHIEPKALEGIFAGKWGDVTGEPHSFFKFEFMNGGNLVRINEAGAIIATGTWHLTGLELAATYTHSNGEKHSIGGLYTGFNGEITGTWGYGNSKAGGGTFYLRKQ